MRSLIRCSLLVLLTVCTCGVTLGQIRREHYPWGRFESGAWKLVRVVTETFEDGRTLTSITETKTTLKEVTEDGVTLTVEVLVEVAGRQFDTDPQTVRQEFHGEPASGRVEIKNLGNANVTIQGREIPCKVRQLDVTSPTGRTATTIYYSDSVAPYLLKRDNKTTDLQGNVLSETTVDVVAVDVPYNVLGFIRNAAHLKAVHRNSKSTTTTLAVTCTDVPGGVVCHTLKEVDNEGRLVRRGSLELIGYGLEPDEEDTGGFFRRRRAKRARKSNRYYMPR